MISHRCDARGVAGTACVALILAGCSTTTTGTASPAPTTASPSNSVFAGLNACQVLDRLGADQGFEPGENKSPRNECVAVKPDPESASYALGLDPGQGLAEFAASSHSPVTEITVNGRNAMQVTDDRFGGDCAVAIEVSAHARAVIIVTMVSASQLAMACPKAKRFAEQVEPLLPKTG
ncbi:MAG TPA: DUF3558 domain-containing protein [Amycolatopsis sp.]|jgi:hypothetical protein|nr:DUF3558 domain-containing protein [Amycolatopsis sp.]